MQPFTIAQRTRAIVNHDRAEQARQNLADQLHRGEWPLLAPLMVHAQRVIARCDAARNALWFAR